MLLIHNIVNVQKVQNATGKEAVEIYGLTFPGTNEPGTVNN